MKILNFIIGIVFLISILSCNNNDCNELPRSFKDYDEAIDKIRSVNYMIEDSLNTSPFSWIIGAYYYSCDGKTGFLLLKTDVKEFLHSNIPVILWKEFKNSEFPGIFYNKYIKHKYYFKPN